MSPNHQKALLPIIPAKPDDFGATTTAAEALGSDGSTFGKIYGGKVVSIRASADSIYICATYGQGATLVDADTDCWEVTTAWEDFFVPGSCRLSIEASTGTPNLLVAVTSQ